MARPILQDRGRRSEAVLGVALVFFVACAAATSDDRPREELQGDGGGAAVSTSGSGPITSGSGGAGGQPLGGGGSGGEPAVGGMAPGGSGPVCDATDEPNDSQITAKNLGAINDCDGNGSTVVGTLDGPGDADWYRYDGSDAFGCVVDPTRALTASGSLRLCKFVDCPGAAVTCNNGSQSAVSPEGHLGCCHTQGFGVGIECDGIDDDARIFLRFDQASAGCVDYSLDYHY
ncbi:MAG: hypothetical protein R3B72_22015 [Polyangiaceae bacterium]